MIEIVSMGRHHMDELVYEMREKDRREQIALGVSPAEAVEQTWLRTLIARTALVDGKVAACWGVGGCSLGGVGTPWLLTTKACERVPFEMARRAKSEVRNWLRIFGRLENIVDASYEEACRFVGIIGFNLDAPEPIAAGTFRKFWMER